MEPMIIKNFYSKDMMDLIRLQVQIFKSEGGKNLGVQEEREKFFRKEVHSPELFKALHFLMNERANEIFPEKVKPSYSFVSMYDDERSICPLHVDRPQCKYNVDVCVDQKKAWPLFVNGKSFEMFPGDAVIYSGTDHPHYRNKIEKDNFCDLVFFHFVPESYNGGLD